MSRRKVWFYIEKVGMCYYYHVFAYTRGRDVIVLASKGGFATAEHARKAGLETCSALGYTPRDW